MKTRRLYILLLFVNLLAISVYGQQLRKLQNQPHADQKMYHIGFMVGIHTQDLIMNNSGFLSPQTKEAWFAEIPSYSVGLSVGIIGDRYLNEYFNLRLTPSLHFGERHFVFKEQTSGEEYDVTLRNNVLNMPLYLKFSAARSNNYRPYFIAGGYASMAISQDKNEVLRFNKMDYGIEFGVGCNFYLPLFKLCPELKFSFGLNDLISKDNSDLKDKDLLKYRDALASGKSRMISLVFNFE